jgi:ABC-type sugar transport system ATPase subunit
VQVSTLSNGDDVPVLRLRGITKTFPGVKALEDIEFELKRGEVHALMGENGAGKSTFVKILSGVHPADRGTMELEGDAVTIGSPAAAQALGIVPVHQELHLEPYLSVAENIFLGRQPLNRWGFVDYSAMNREAARLLAELGVDIDPTVALGTISIAQRQIVAIARAISTICRVIIFDEPTSSLTERESSLLFDVIRRLRSQQIGVIYISHRMEEIFALCDRVTVFRDGRYVATKLVRETTMTALIGMMIGRSIADLFQKEPASIGEVVLDASAISVPGVLEDITLQVRKGEIVGLAGLVGAGRTELARAIFGDLPLASGVVKVSGMPLRNGHLPRDAIAAGIGFVPEDRKEQGLVTELPVRENIGMAMLRSLSSLGIIKGAKERRLAERYVSRLSIKTPSIEQKALFLSGGNQQRVVIAKWLAAEPKVLIVDEPTRGIDVGAKAEIHGLLSELARQGVAILMISSDMPEVIAMSDRVIVMHGGSVRGELTGNGITQEAIMHHATGQELAASQEFS